MNKLFRIAFLVFFALVAGTLVVLYVSDQTIAILEPEGSIGVAESDLIITATLLMLIVVVPVLILAGVFAWKYREGNKEAHHAPDWEHNHIAECCWWGVPCVIIAVLGVLTWRSSHELDPFKPIVNGTEPVEVQVVALDWKWLFIYPKWGIATVNFLQIPEKTPIHFEITADAPMNSFWIPQLGGQIYAMPAMRSQLYLVADKVGRYRGSSANFSGEGFAGMVFTTQSSSSEDFLAWVNTVKETPYSLNEQTYKELVQPSQYHPVTYYVLEKTDLFDWIIMQYMAKE